MKKRVIGNKSLNSFLKYSFKHKWTMISVVLLSTLTSVAGALPAWLSKYLIDDVFVSRNQKMMIYVLAGLFLSTLVKVLSGYYANITSGYITETIRKEIRVDIYKHLQHLPLSFYKKNKLGDLMSRLSGDSSVLGQIGFILFDMLKEFVLVFALTFRLFQVDWVLALISILVLPLILSTVRKYTKKILVAGRERQDMSGNVGAFIQESLSGISVIKAFNKSEKMIGKYEAISEEEFRKSYRARKISAKVSPINELFTTLMIVLVALYGGYNIIEGKMTAGDLVSFLTAVGLMQQPLKKLIERNNNLSEALPSADRVLEILDVPVEEDSHGEAIPFVNIVEDIELKNLTFKYEDSDKEILSGLNLKVKKGEVIALVGKSGSGKTTLVNLIPRFFNFGEGMLFINGIDVNKFSLKEYRSHIGIVPQETFLFSGTIADNLKFGRDTITFEEMVEATKMANAYDFIMELPLKFDTEVGERGTLLSGGQKQRIAIARALIQDPQIMILDEATSALDTESERLVQSALDKLMENRTTFVIAHRLSTILDADKIVVMENGKILEVGNHQELMNVEGKYRGLYDIQFGKKKELEYEI